MHAALLKSRLGPAEDGGGPQSAERQLLFCSIPALHQPFACSACENASWPFCSSHSCTCGQIREMDGDVAVQELDTAGTAKVEFVGSRHRFNFVDGLVGAELVRAEAKFSPPY